MVNVNLIIFGGIELSFCLKLENQKKKPHITVFYNKESWKSVNEKKSSEEFATTCHCRKSNLKTFSFCFIKYFLKIQKSEQVTTNECSHTTSHNKWTFG